MTEPFPRSRARIAAMLKEAEMTDDNPALTFVMFKRRNGQFALKACRGLNKGCAKTRAAKLPKKPCPDCIDCDDPRETLEQVIARINRGDA